jgi:predicted aconitase
MELTSKEEAMLAGEYGEGLKAALEILVKMGELYGAKRFLEVKNAHIDAAAYTTIWEAGTEFIEFLVDNGAKVAVPTTINPVSRDIEYWEKTYTSAEFAKKSERLEKAYLKLGVTPTWTCAPYQCTNVPIFGEAVAWSESNAVNYVNSVIGARAVRLPDLVDVCCAVCGRVPEYDLYIEENRAGDMLFELEGFENIRSEDSRENSKVESENKYVDEFKNKVWFEDSADYALLGYYIGNSVINKVPVVIGLPEHTMPDNLKAFSAAAASSGAVALFHAVGFTPEARTLEQAFRGKTDYETIKVTPEDLIKMKAELDTGDKEEIDMVLLGCPHLSFAELEEVASLIKGKKVAKGTHLWVQTSHSIYELGRRAGITQVIEEAGGLVLRDTCLMEMEYNGKWKGKQFVTNSGKAMQYAPAINEVKITLCSMKECVEVAIKGK